MSLIGKTLNNVKTKHDFNANRLKTKELSIICNCCLGGMLYRDLGLRFLSPTIKLNIPFDDFLKFVSHLPYYKDMPIKPCEPLIREFEQLGGGSMVEFPCGSCDDIRILFQHYGSFDEAKEKWETRAKRIDLNNTVIVFLTWGNVSEELIRQFLSLPYKKVMFVDDPKKTDGKTVFHLTVPEDKHWFDIDEKRSKYNTRHYYDQFNWIKFFNK